MSRLLFSNITSGYTASKVEERQNEQGTWNGIDETGCSMLLTINNE